MEKALQYSLLLYIVFSSIFLQAQVVPGGGPTCAEAVPFCSDVTGCSPSASGFAEPGPDYGCLGLQPNPTWYFIRIGMSGDLNLLLSQFPAINCQQSSNVDIDVDFIIYGPFSQPTGNCGNLTAANTIDCSYSTAGMENLSIPNAQAGEYYLLLITNFNGNPAIFTLQDDPNNPSTATTDCDILNIQIERCDNDGDGQVTFDFDTEFDMEVLGTDFGSSSISYHPTETDAQTGASPITNYTTTVGIDPPEQVFGRILNGAGQFEGVIAIDLIAIAGPGLLTEEVILEDCDNDMDGAAIFDLTSTFGSFIQPLTDYTVSVFGDEMDAQSGMGPSLVANPSNYGGMDQEVLYVSITDNATGCISVGRILLQLIPGPDINPEVTLTVCDLDFDGLASFDLSEAFEGFIQPTSDYTFTIYREEADALQNDGSSLVTNITGYNGIGLEILYVNILDNATGCFRVGMIILQLDDPPNVLDQTISICDVSGTGVTVNLTQVEAALNMHPDGTNISYHYTEIDANTHASAGVIFAPGQFPVTSPYAPVYVRVENAINPDCFSVIAIFFDASTPTALDYTFQELCEQDSGFITIDLTNIEGDVSSGQTGVLIDFFHSQIDATNYTNPIRPAANFQLASPFDPIYVRVQNATDAACFGIAEINFDVSSVSAHDLRDTFCMATGSNTVDLTAYYALLTDDLLSDVDISFHHTASDADSGIAAITGADNYSFDSTTTLYVRVASAMLSSCFKVATLTLYTEQVASPSIRAVDDLCVGDTLVLRIDNAPEDAIITWYDDNGTAFSNDTNVIVLTDLEVGDYIYEATLTVGACTSRRSSVAWQVNALPIIDEIITTDITCAGDMDGSIRIQLSNGDPPNYQFEWLDDASATHPRTGLDPETYQVIIRNPLTGCATLSDSIEITSPDSLRVMQDVTNERCVGQADGAIDITITGGTSPYSYQWNDGVTMEDRSNLTTGDYAVTITDANGCSSELSAEIFVSGLEIVPSITPNPCLGDSLAAIEVDIQGGTPPYVLSWNTEDTSNRIDQLTQGEYIVVVADANGCTGELRTNITDPTELTISETHVDINCHNQSTGMIDLSVEGGTGEYSFRWTHGSAEEDQFNLGSGTYMVTVTDENGCTNTTQILLSEPSLLELSENHFDAACGGSIPGSIDLDVDGGVPPYRYSWSNNSKEQDITELSADRYVVTVTDANGCVDSLGAQIDILPAFEVELTGPNEILLGESSTITASITADIDQLTDLTWSPLDVLSCDDCLQPILTAPIDGGSEVLVTIYTSLSDACFDTDSLIVRILRPDIEVFAPNAFSPNNDGINDIFTLYSNSLWIDEISELKIYNRWGGKVFENFKFDIENTQAGWDGFVRGEKAAEGTYVYSASVLTIDGELLSLSGTLHLIR